MKPPDFSYLTDAYFGFRASEVLPGLLEHFHIRRPLLVTDCGLVELGVIERLPLQPAAIFDQVQTNPAEAEVLEALARFRQAQCDGIVAVGGGSPIDLAKGLAILVEHPEPLEQYALLCGGSARIRRDLPPLIAVPTTAGSGSEVGRAALLVLASGDKVAFLSPRLLPKAAVCDPELSVSLPPHLTAGTGMDAISHCVETVCSPRFNPVAEAIALDGLQRGVSHVLRATAEATDRSARREMMLCALEGGLAFQKGLGAVHSLSHPLGGTVGKRLHHGTLNAIFLPLVMEFNADSGKEKMDVMADRLGLERGSLLPDFFRELIRQLGLPLRLRELGLAESDLQGLAEKALKDHCTATNPRPLDLAACRSLYRQAL